MFGKIFLLIYVIIQLCISLITEYTVRHHGIFSKIGEETRVFRVNIYVILALVPVLGAFLPKSDFKYFCMEFGNIWLGFFMFYSAMVLFLTLILYIVYRIRKVKNDRLIGHALNFAFVIAISVTIYGLIHAQNPILVNYDIEIKNESAGGKDMKIVLLGDLHLSVNSDIKATEKMVEKVNSCDADLIVIAGDIFTSNYDGLKHPEKYSAALRRMKSKYGVYVVCGNHDVEENLFSGFPISPKSEAFRTPDMEKFFDDSGFNVLYDENVEVADGLITLSGRVDGEKSGDGINERLTPEELLKDVDSSKPVIVLQHEPVEFEELSQSGADLVLCGHTHNGQIFPGNLVVPFFNENGYGVKELYGIQTVVTAGVGYYGPPIRVGTDSEVTLINLSFVKE